MDTMGNWLRTHSCGALSKHDVGQEVIFMGWVLRRRDHGGLIFIDLCETAGVSLRWSSSRKLRPKPINCAANGCWPCGGRLAAKPELMANLKLASGNGVPRGMKSKEQRVVDLDAAAIGEATS